MGSNACPPRLFLQACVCVSNAVHVSFQYFVQRHVCMFGLKLHSGWRIRLTADFTSIILTVPSGLA